jgi:hypothetical protein
MMWVLSSTFVFLAIVGVYLRYKVSSQAGVVDPDERQEAYWRAVNRLGLFAVSMLVLYLLALLVLRW